MSDVATSNPTTPQFLFGTSGANARQDHVFCLEGCESRLLASSYATLSATFDMLATP